MKLEQLKKEIKQGNFEVEDIHDIGGANVIITDRKDRFVEGDLIVKLDDARAVNTLFERVLDDFGRNYGPMFYRLFGLSTIRNGGDLIEIIEDIESFIEKEKDIDRNEEGYNERLVQVIVEIVGRKTYFEQFKPNRRQIAMILNQLKKDIEQGNFEVKDIHDIGGANVIVTDKQDRFVEGDFIVKLDDARAVNTLYKIILDTFGRNYGPMFYRFFALSVLKNEGDLIKIIEDLDSFTEKAEDIRAGSHYNERLNMAIIGIIGMDVYLDNFKLNRWEIAMILEQLKKDIEQGNFEVKDIHDLGGANVIITDRRDRFVEGDFIVKLDDARAVNTLFEKVLKDFGNGYGPMFYMLFALSTIKNDGDLIGIIEDIETYVEREIHVSSRYEDRNERLKPVIAEIVGEDLYFEHF